MGSYLLPTMGQWRKWIPIRFKSWPQMQCDKQGLRGRGGPTKMHNAMDKAFKVNKKKGIIGWTYNHTPALCLAQDLTHVQCKSKMMLEK
jgi:hypothetical protein